MKTMYCVALGLVWILAPSAHATPMAELRVEVDDLSGNPISSIAAGQDFKITVAVQDIRSPVDEFPGIFAAYLDLSFDSTLADIAPTTTPVFGSPFAPYGGGASYSLSHNVTTVKINAGSFSLSLTSPGNAPQVLYTIQAHAQAPGIENFLPSFTSDPGMDVLFYNPPDVLSPSDLQFVGASLTIVPEPSSLALVAAGILATSAVFVSRCGQRKRT